MNFAQIRYLGATFGILVVSCEHFERDGDSVSSTVGTESVPDGPMHSIVHNIQTSQGHKSHGPAAKLRGKVPLGTSHPYALTDTPAQNKHDLSIMEPLQRKLKHVV